MLSRILKIAGSALLALALALPGGIPAANAASPAAEPAAIPATVFGKLSYRERIALPPGSEAVVQLLDTSRADAPATVVAEQRIAIGGQVPIPYRLDYDAATIDPHHRYTVSARIVNGERLLFVSDTAPPVITRGSPGQADLLLKQAPGKQ